MLKRSALDPFFAVDPTGTQTHCPPDTQQRRRRQEYNIRTTENTRDGTISEWHRLRPGVKQEHVDGRTTTLCNRIRRHRTAETTHSLPPAISVTTVPTSAFQGPPTTPGPWTPLEIVKAESRTSSPCETKGKTKNGGQEKQKANGGPPT